MQIADKNHSAVAMVEQAIARAKACESYHVFVSTNFDNALEKAKQIDARIARGEPVGRLAGVPYALKDNFLSREGRTTASAKILEPFESPITATAVKKLEDEGAIMLGRTNLDAFAHGSSTENSYFGPSKNAIDPERVPGGSSGGSAAAVALGIVPFATGTDTGGSIRQPASFNGIYGLKPTYGCISRYGVVAMASSTDCVGFFANSPADLDLLMSICSGRDPYDMTTLPNYYNDSSDAGTGLPEPSRFGRSETYIPDGTDKVAQQSLPAAQRMTSKAAKSFGKPVTASHRRIGIIKDFDNDSVAPSIRQALSTKIAQLKSQGHEIIELEMPTLKYALAVYYIIVPAEVSSNLSRHDGIRYGYRSPDSPDLASLYGHTRAEGFMPENKRRIMIGNFVLSSGFYDAYFLKAAKARTLIIQEYEEAFEKCDFILTPVSPSPAFRFGEKTNDPVAMYLEDVMSVPANLAGVPSLAIPAGTTDEGLPVGLQLLGPKRSDRALLAFAKELA